MIQMLDLKRMSDKKYQSHKMKSDNSQTNKETDGTLIDDSVIGGNFDSKKINTNASNFRVKNNTRTNSNAFLMDKSLSVGEKSSTNLFHNYDDMGFSKLKSSKPDT